jgi:TrmH family RNA methyltransferase
MPRGGLVTLIRDLKLRRGRERRRLALAEGVRLLEEALAADLPIQGIAWSPTLEATPRGRALKARLETLGAPCQAFSDRDLEELADTEQPQGVVGVIQPRRWSLDEIPVDSANVILVLDAVQDPGNVGTMARTAFGLGASALVALKGTAELANPKVLRGSMGALFRLPGVECDDTALLQWTAKHGFALWAADAEGVPIRECPLFRPLALVVGNEGAGIRPSLLESARGRVAIPLRPEAESLNVAVAAGILLYEVLHGR